GCLRGGVLPRRDRRPPDGLRSGLRVIAQLWLRLLTWMILAYRRFVSGGGPLRGVRCSFAPDESCSAYGLRAARESRTAREALGKIGRRLRRCRDACLVGDGAA